MTSPDANRPMGQADPSNPSKRLDVSVVVLTLNEEINIEECLKSCAFSDDVHVLDSGSTDKTCEIAKRMGATVHIHPFESFGAQRNWAIDNIEMKHDWVFHLDADERFTPEIVEEMRVLLESDPPEAGFHVPHKLMFMNRWLRRSGGYPTYQMRLFHKGRMRFCDYGHGQREDTEGEIGFLREPYLHYSFSKGLYDWLDKHNRYSSLEALQFMETESRLPRLRDLVTGGAIERRRAWKRVTYRVPMWPMMRYLAILFMLGGIFEGRAGRTYAKLLATYEQMIQMKLRLLHAARSRGRPAFEADSPRVSDVVSFDAKDTPIELARSGQAHASGETTGEMAGKVVGDTDRQRLGDDQGRTDETGQLIPEASPWTFKQKVFRALWMLVGKPMFRLSFHNWYGVRRGLLRAFGARIGKDVRIRPSVNVEIPWNVDLRDGAIIGDYAILYSLGKITIGERTIISQYAHLCAGTHDHTDRRFPLIRDPIEIGPDAWIGADAYVGPRVRIGRLCVLGARSSAYKDLDPETVYVGNPSRPLKKRELA